MDRPFEGGSKNILPQYNPGFMRVVRMGAGRFGKIDPKGEKKRKTKE